MTDVCWERKKGKEMEKWWNGICNEKVRIARIAGGRQSNRDGVVVRCRCGIVDWIRELEKLSERDVRDRIGGVKGRSRKRKRRVNSTELRSS